MKQGLCFTPKITKTEEVKAQEVQMNVSLIVFDLRRQYGPLQRTESIDLESSKPKSSRKRNLEDIWKEIMEKALKLFEISSKETSDTVPEEEGSDESIAIKKLKRSHKKYTKEQKEVVLELIQKCSSLLR